MRNRNMSRAVSLMLLLVVSCSLFVSCAGRQDAWKTEASGRSVTIEVNTMYAGDEYGEIFFEAVDEWERDTGYKVKPVSNTSDEAYKKRIQMDFQTGAEPDVLFYFNGLDSAALVANKRVIPID